MEKGKISKGMWRDIYNRDGFICNECHGRLLLPPEYKALKSIISNKKEYAKPLEYLKFTFGHIKPVFYGGNDTLDNMVGEHFWCNKEKKTDIKLSSLKISWIRSYANEYVGKLMEYLPADFKI